MRITFTVGITVYPIGFVRSSLNQIDLKDVIDDRAYIEVDVDYKAGLKGLDGFSHIIVVFYMHMIKSWKLTEKPRRHNPHNLELGIFATRSPYRPNRIGVSVVKLKGIENNIVYFVNRDIFDGSPVLDIKPYLPEKIDELKLGWYEENSTLNET